MNTNDSHRHHSPSSRFHGRRWRRLLRVGLIILLISQTWPATAEEQERDAFASTLQPAFEMHCVKCHGKEGKVKGKVNLLALKHDADLLHRPELIEDIIAVLHEEDVLQLNTGNLQLPLSKFLLANEYPEIRRGTEISNGPGIAGRSFRLCDGHRR